MLSLRARAAVGKVMRYGCYLYFFPFIWDTKTRRLVSKISKHHDLIFHFHGFVQCYMFIFSVLRLLLGLNDNTLPPRIRVMNGLWILAYIHGIQGFLELKYRRKQILAFANSIFQYIDEQIEKHGAVGDADQPNHRLDNDGRNWVSNSLYFNCTNAGDDVGSLLEKLPFFLLENYLVAVFFFLLAFNWFIVFLGLGWLRTELREACLILTSSEVEPSLLDRVSEKYRELQCGARLLNEGFRLYLGWAPTIFMGHVSLLLFASFRYWNEDIISYLMFPSCGLRCMVDAVTPLAVAGHVFDDSTKVLQLWEAHIASSRKKIMGRLINKDKSYLQHIVRFKKSCTIIACAAGSFYKMKTAILPVNLNNLAQLTLNMLVALPHHPKVAIK